MNRILRNGIYIFMGVLIIGCTTLPVNTQNIKQGIISTNIDNLFSEWGVPSLSAPLPSAKGMMHVWDNGGCKSNVSTDENGTITNYSVSGNCSFIQW